MARNVVERLDLLRMFYDSLVLVWHEMMHVLQWLIRSRPAIFALGDVQKMGM